MSNHTIASPITTWAELRNSDREVLNRAEVAALLTLDPRTVDHGIEDGTIPAVHIGRRVLIPRRPFLRSRSVSTTRRAHDGPTQRSGAEAASAWHRIDHLLRDEGRRPLAL